MNFCTFASGSGGNATLVSQGGTHLLVDAGISMRRIVTALRALDLRPEDIGGVLITHEHSDHVSGLFNLIKYYRLPVYAPGLTAKSICRTAPHLCDVIHSFDAGSCFEVGEIAIHSFPTPHDTPDSAGYRLSAHGASLSVVTDLGCVPECVLNAVLGSDAAVLETNHDIGMLRSGPYPEYLKRRILSDRGHLSNNVGALLARRLVEEGAKLLVLAHLSQENNRPELALTAVSQALAAGAAVSGRDFDLSVAPRSVSGKVYTF